MIDLSKTYQTRRGDETRLSFIDGGLVYGFIKNEKAGRWMDCTWDATTGWRYPSNAEDEFDLIEVKPRIKREAWVNVYPEPSVDGLSIYKNKGRADAQSMDHRIACVKIEIDCEEGEGL